MTLDQRTGTPHARSCVEYAPTAADRARWAAERAAEAAWEYVGLDSSGRPTFRHAGGLEVVLTLARPGMAPAWRVRWRGALIGAAYPTAEEARENAVTEMGRAVAAAAARPEPRSWQRGRKPGGPLLTQRIVAAVEHLGEATTAELATYLGESVSRVSPLVSKMARLGRVRLLRRQPRVGSVGAPICVYGKAGR